MLNWRLPVTEAGCKKLLELLSSAQAELAKLSTQISDQETHLDDHVYKLYGLDKDDQKVIGDFLARYSSSRTGTPEAEETAEATEE